MWSGVAAFVREVGAMLLDEYDRWLTGTILLILVVGVIDAVGPHWVATSVVWLAFVPAVALAIHAGVRSRRRTAAARAEEPTDARTAIDEAPSPAPVLTFQAAVLEPRDTSASSQSSGESLFAAITNSRPGSAPAGKAVRAAPSITWTTPEGRVRGPIEGRWPGAPSAPTIDLLPNGHPYLIDLAMRLPGERSFRVVGRERSFVVPEGRATVTVELRGANFAPVSAAYLVWSADDNPALGFREVL